MIRLGSFLTGGFLLTRIFFSVYKTAFPPQLFRLAQILWIAVFSQSVWYLTGLSPLIGAGLFILTFTKEEENAKEAAGKAVFVWIFFFCLGLLQERLFFRVSSSLFLAAGLAFLLCFQTPVHEIGRPHFLKTRLRLILSEAGEIFFQSAVLVLLMNAVRWIMPGLESQETGVFLFLLSYAAASLRKKEGIFFAAVFFFSFQALENDGFSMGKTLVTILELTAGFSLCRFLITGIQARLLFSAPPKAWAGAPVLLMAAGLMTIALSWISLP